LDYLCDTHGLLDRLLGPEDPNQAGSRAAELSTLETSLKSLVWLANEDDASLSPGSVAKSEKRLDMLVALNAAAQARKERQEDIDASSLKEIWVELKKLNGLCLVTKEDERGGESKSNNPAAKRVGTYLDGESQQYHVHVLRWYLSPARLQRSREACKEFFAFIDAGSVPEGLSTVCVRRLLDDNGKMHKAVKKSLDVFLNKTVIDDDTGISYAPAWLLVPEAERSRSEDSLPARPLAAACFRFMFTRSLMDITFTEGKLAALVDHSFLKQRAGRQQTRSPLEEIEAAALSTVFMARVADVFKCAPPGHDFRSVLLSKEGSEQVLKTFVSLIARPGEQWFQLFVSFAERACGRVGLCTRLRDMGAWFPEVVSSSGAETKQSSSSLDQKATEATRSRQKSKALAEKSLSQKWDALHEASLVPSEDGGDGRLTMESDLRDLQEGLANLNRDEADKARRCKRCPHCGRAVLCDAANCGMLKCGQNYHANEGGAEGYNEQDGCKAMFYWDSAPPYIVDTSDLERRVREKEEEVLSNSKSCELSKQYFEQLHEFVCSIPNLCVGLGDPQGAETPGVKLVPGHARNLLEDLRRNNEAGVALRGEISPDAPRLMRFLEMRREARPFSALPDLIEFYQWLHSSLEHLITEKSAMKYSMGEVLVEDKLSKRFPRAQVKRILKLWERVKHGYNTFVEYVDGRIPFECKTLVLEKIGDDTILLRLLSPEDRDTDLDWLYRVIEYMTTLYNDLVQQLTGATKETREVVAAASIARGAIMTGDLHPLEARVDSSSTSYFESSIDQYWIPEEEDGGGKFNVTSLWKVVQESFLQRCPCISDPSTLRHVFRFRGGGAKSASVDESGAHDGSRVTLESIRIQLRAIKIDAAVDLGNAMNAMFHDVSFNDLKNLLVGMKMVVDSAATLNYPSMGEVCVKDIIMSMCAPSSDENKAGIIEEGKEYQGNSGNGGQDASYGESKNGGGGDNGETKRSQNDRGQARPSTGVGGIDEGPTTSTMLGKVGLATLSPNQATYFLDLNLSELLALAEFVFTQIATESYDYAHHPITLKVPLSAEMAETLSSLSENKNCLELITSLEKCLVNAEPYISKSLPAQPMNAYLKSIGGYDEDKEGDAATLAAIHQTLCIQHYVSTRQLLRRLANKASTNSRVRFQRRSKWSWTSQQLQRVLGGAGEDGETDDDTDAPAKQTRRLWFENPDDEVKYVSPKRRAAIAIQAVVRGMFARGTLSTHHRAAQLIQRAYKKFAHRSYHYEDNEANTLATSGTSASYFFNVGKHFRHEKGSNTNRGGRAHVGGVAAAVCVPVCSALYMIRGTHTVWGYLALFACILMLAAWKASRGVETAENMQEITETESKISTFDTRNVSESTAAPTAAANLDSPHAESMETKSAMATPAPTEENSAPFSEQEDHTALTARTSRSIPQADSSGGGGDSGGGAGSGGGEYKGDDSEDLYERK
jgi:hypothetical protein